MAAPRSARFDPAQRAPHVPVMRTDLEDDAGNVIQRDVPMMPDGNVTADRTAANLLIRQVNVPLSSLSAPARDLLQNDLASAYLRTWRGIRYQDSIALGQLYNDLASWTPVNGGVMNGCSVNSSGGLQMGPS